MLCAALLVGCVDLPPGPPRLGPVVDEHDPLVLDLGGPIPSGILGAGWSGDEVDGHTTYRWSDGRASEIRFSFVRPMASDARLTLVAHAFAPLAPLRVGLALDGVDLGTVVFGAAWERRSIRVPMARLAEGPHRLVATYPSTASPSSSEPGDLDRRDLALAFDEIRIEPLYGAAVDLGTPGARAALLDGWGADSIADARTVVVVDDRATAALDLDLDDGPFVVGLDARAAAAGVVEIAVNGAPAGRLQVASAWQRDRLAIAPGLLRPGKNRIDVSVASPTQVDALWIAPAPGWVEIDAGTAAARRQLAAGWDPFDEESGPRTVVWSVGARAALAVTMRPEATPYALVVEALAIEAPAPLDAGVVVNGQPVGTLAFSADDFVRATLTIPRGVLVAGDNRVELSWSRLVRPSDLDPDAADGRELAAWVDRVYLVPARSPR
jgi:hypothetical protein